MRALPVIKLKTRTIATLGIYLAVMILMNFTPQLGYIHIGNGFAITLMLVPVILITLHYGWRGAIFSWVTFGFLSLAAMPIYSPIIMELYGIGGAFVLLLCGRLSAMLVVVLIAYLIRDKLKLTIWWQALIIGIATPLLNSTFVLSYAAALNSGKTFIALIATSGVNIGVELAISVVVALALVPLVKYLVQKEESTKITEY